MFTLVPDFVVESMNGCDDRDSVFEPLGHFVLAGCPCQRTPLPNLQRPFSSRGQGINSIGGMLILGRGLRHQTKMGVVGQ